MLEVERRAIRHSNCCLLNGIAFPTEGVYRLEVRDEAAGLSVHTNPIRCSQGPAEQRLRWGMLHCHTELSDGLLFSDLLTEGVKC